MKGKIHTDELMEPIIDKEQGLRTGRQDEPCIFALEVPNYPKPIIFDRCSNQYVPQSERKMRYRAKCN